MDRERTRLYLVRCSRCGRVFDEEGFGAHAKPGGFIPCYGFTAEHIEVIPADPARFTTAENVVYQLKAELDDLRASIEPLREALRQIEARARAIPANPIGNDIEDLARVALAAEGER